MIRLQRINKGMIVTMKTFSATAACLLLTSCVMDYLRPYNEREIIGIWEEVKASYPPCKEKDMPGMVFFVTDGELMGVYNRSIHTVFIDRWAAYEVFEEEFLHACGYTLGENYCDLSRSELGREIRKHIAKRLIENARISQSRKPEKGDNPGIVVSQKGKGFTH